MIVDFEIYINGSGHGSVSIDAVPGWTGFNSEQLKEVEEKLTQAVADEVATVAMGREHVRNMIEQKRLKGS